MGSETVAWEGEATLDCSVALFFFFFCKFKVFNYLERGEGREKERGRNINVWLPLTYPQLGTWPTTQACTLTGNRTHDLLVYRTMPSPLSHTSQGCSTAFATTWACVLMQFWCPPLERKGHRADTR